MCLLFKSHTTPTIHRGIHNRYSFHYKKSYNDSTTITFFPFSTLSSLCFTTPFFPRQFRSAASISPTLLSSSPPTPLTRRKRICRHALLVSLMALTVPLFPWNCYNDNWIASSTLNRAPKKRLFPHFVVATFGTHRPCTFQFLRRSLTLKELNVLVLRKTTSESCHRLTSAVSETCWHHHY